MSQAAGIRGVEVRNWEGSLVTRPEVVVMPESVDDIVAILRDRERYPSPVRAVGSRHSTTRCGNADGGTIIDMAGWTRIVEIGPDYVTAQAGALYIDVAKEMEQRGLQFHVNIELGNLTIGAACCTGTKDASMPGEFGQVSSYATSIKCVTPNGSLLTADESQPELLQAMRSSYGLFGIVYEATFRVRPLQAMAVHHETYSLDEFTRTLPDLARRGESMMLYLYPFLGSVTVEYRQYVAPEGSGTPWPWRIRNWGWSKAFPAVGSLITRRVPSGPVRSALLNGMLRASQLALTLTVNARNTSPADQQIRYPDVGGRSKYTFSLWAFPEETYTRVLRDYFRFCRDYERDHGFRCDLLNVGYRILKDESSLLSYSAGGDVVTIDPVSTGGPGWDDFLKAYNRFCSDNGGIPLFNQTKWIEPYQARKAFGARLTEFEALRKTHDPADRLLNTYFAELLATE